METLETEATEQTAGAGEAGDDWREVQLEMKDGFSGVVDPTECEWDGGERGIGIWRK